MKRICMDCKTVMSEDGEDLETHGICDTCFADRLKEMEG